MPGESTQSDEILIRYLLGSSPEEETERLDALSITDAEFSLRLKAAENDLVDAYVKNELSTETVQRFESFYLASPLRSRKWNSPAHCLRFRSGITQRGRWVGSPRCCLFRVGVSWQPLRQQ